MVTPRGARPGDSVLLTKGVPIEATAILAREFPERLAGVLSAKELRHARFFLHEPGISILRDAQIALAAGKVTAMRDPTEGGLVTALWELAQASGRKLWFDPSAMPVPTSRHKSAAYSAWTRSERLVQVRFCLPRAKRQRVRSGELWKATGLSARKSAESTAGRTACGQFPVRGVAE